MKQETTSVPVSDDVRTNSQGVVRRRSFLPGLGVAEAAALPAGQLFAPEDNKVIVEENRR